MHNILFFLVVIEYKQGYMIHHIHHALIIYEVFTMQLRKIQIKPIAILSKFLYISLKIMTTEREDVFSLAMVHTFCSNSLQETT